MSQLFFNLIGNSLKFIRPDIQPKIHIHCSIASPQEIRSIQLKEGLPYYKIQFTDNGIGMKPENTQKIFSIFQNFTQKMNLRARESGWPCAKK